jgi:hypothetical protein
LCQSRGHDIIEEHIVFSRRLHSLSPMFLPYRCTFNFAKQSRLNASVFLLSVSRDKIYAEYTEYIYISSLRKKSVSQLLWVLDRSRLPKLPKILVLRGQVSWLKDIVLGS